MSKRQNNQPKVLSQNVISKCDGYWEWFDRSDIAIVPYEITGKYLFFSPNRELLVEIAINELENGGFHHAKTLMAGVTPLSEEYVLCLYFKDDSRKHALAEKYRDKGELKYRFWKSDIETLAGKYSKQFLDKLSEEDQKIFQTKPENQ
jgi:hypothetical protein